MAVETDQQIYNQISECRRVERGLDREFILKFVAQNFYLRNFPKFSSTLLETASFCEFEDIIFI